ncbi:hypothetical protein HDV00_007866 [Rhizophlyctis rosea]|nr:hypothetical protein HDV00_007866 [Rhizophlyctis rosea]
MPGHKRKADSPGTETVNETDLDLDTVEALEEDDEYVPGSSTSSGKHKTTNKTNQKQKVAANAESNKIPEKTEKTVWTDREQAVARTLMDKYGTKFTKVAEELNRICGKTPKQINSWWYNRELPRRKKAGESV